MYPRFAFLWVFCLQAAGSALEPLPSQVPVPSDNPITAEKIHLGKQLFFDPRISKTGRTSCNNCHNLMAGGDDSQPVSQKPDGTFSRHSAPTVWNAAFLSSFFWSGAANTLEEQAEGPLEEMGLGDTEAIVQRVKAIKLHQDCKFYRLPRYEKA